MSSDVRFSGPLFDGKAEAAGFKAGDAIEEKLAEMARDKARDIQLARIRVESHGGAEPASLHVESSSFGKVVTDSSAIVYGPWLEGTGSRNETTRFKGYHAMRIAAEEVNAEAEALADETIKPYVEEMN